jgi:16S rRNA (guanine527-N7)-methyltransferase
MTPRSRDDSKKPRPAKDEIPAPASEAVAGGAGQKPAEDGVEDLADEVSEEPREEDAGLEGGTQAEEEVVARPDTPVPSLDEMRAALEWAFRGEEVTPAQLEIFARHALMVLERNRVMNLTAIVDPKEVAAKHYLDSWRVIKLVPLMARKVLDLGSGGGFPGVPIAVAEPNLSMTLADSAAKKVGFLSECITSLGLRNVRAVADRAETWLGTNRVDVVVVRAISSVRENVRILRKVRHSLKDLVMYKGSSWSREVRAAEREAERLGFKLDTVWEHELPGEMGGRAILIYRAPGGQGG